MIPVSLRRLLRAGGGGGRGTPSRFSRLRGSGAGRRGGVLPATTAPRPVPTAGHAAPHRPAPLLPHNPRRRVPLPAAVPSARGAAHPPQAPRSTRRLQENGKSRGGAPLRPPHGRRGKLRGGRRAGPGRDSPALRTLRAVKAAFCSARSCGAAREQWYLMKGKQPVRRMW